jgi:hypothetical protein
MAGEQWLTEFQTTKPGHQCMLVELAGGALSTWIASHAFAMGATIVDPAGNLQKATIAGTSGAIQPSFSGTVGGATADGTVTWTDQGPAIGPGLTFLNNSVFRNMEFVQASDFVREASISILGLKPIKATPRDVYLLVNTKNMAAYYDTNWGAVYDRLFGTPTDRNPQKTHAVLAQLSSLQQRENLPTYHVYVFHDMNKHVTVDKKDFLILHAQSSFGYYVLPHGKYNGWTNSLSGAKQIAPNYYRVAVANNGVAKVVTKVSAVEVNPNPKPNGCFGKVSSGGAMLLIAGILLVGFKAHRSGGNRPS